MTVEWSVEASTWASGLVFALKTSCLFLPVPQGFDCPLLIEFSFGEKPHLANGCLLWFTFAIAGIVNGIMGVHRSFFYANG